MFEFSHKANATVGVAQEGSALCASVFAGDSFETVRYVVRSVLLLVVGVCVLPLLCKIKAL